MLFTIHTGYDGGEKNEDVFVLIFKVDLSCLGDVVFGINHQRTQGVNYNSQDVELLLLSEFDKAVNQHNQYLLSIEISYILIRMAAQSFCDALQHFYVYDFSFNIRLVADQATQECYELFDVFFLLQPLAHCYHDLDAYFCVIEEEMLDFIQ
jgi:hypothetical protein